MRKYSVLAIFVFGLLLHTTSVSAANTTGYAWSESVGWFDFSNATFSDTALTGYAYNDNTGWLVLDGVTNTNGQLGGYAWSESVGYFDFENVTVSGSTGAVEGYAYNDNTGWLSFESGTTVSTAWRQTDVSPEQEEEASSGGGSSGSSKKKVVKPAMPTAAPMPTTAPSVNTPNQVPSNETGAIAILASNPRDLELNAEGADVRMLQQFLNARGFTVNPALGQAGSAGYETTFFGPLTKAALARFQAANGISPAAGYFGPITRAFIRPLSI